MFNTGMTQAQLLLSIQTKLMRIRDALTDAQEMYAWSSGLSATDLVSIGFSAADATTLLTAMNDANAVWKLYSTGLPPSTYPQPPSAYVYQASQAEVMGPL